MTNSFRHVQGSPAERRILAQKASALVQAAERLVRDVHHLAMGEIDFEDMTSSINATLRAIHEVEKS